MIYNWVVSIVGVLPPGAEWVYEVGTLIFVLMLFMLCISPLFIVFSILRKGR